MTRRTGAAVHAAALAAAIGLACLGLFHASHAGATEGPTTLDPAVARAVAEGRERIPVLVYATGGAATQGRAPRADGAAAREFARDHADLLAAAGALAEAGRADAPRPLWLAGAVALAADASAVRDLARRPDVAHVELDPPVLWEPWRPEPVSRAAADGDAAAWGVEAIGAPEVWHRLGIDGSGVTVAVIDSGVDYHHPDLRDAYRGYVGAERPSNYGNWWCKSVDPLCAEHPLYPVDGVGHGTHVAGSALGRGGVGVAPGARWTAARVCQLSDYCNGSWIVEALGWLVSGPEAEWPDVVNMSLSLEDNLALERSVRALLEARIVVVSSSGNDRERVRAPAIYPGVVAVGAVDRAGGLWTESGFGRSLADEPKPDVVAPGVAVTSSVPGGGYALNTGTSMAAPHVAGAVALLRQAAPDLTPAEIGAILRDTATPLTNASGVPDERSGHGLVNAYAAVVAVSDVGRLTGSVTDRLDGAAIPWARVRVATSLGDPVTTATVDEDGRYVFDLAPGRYLLVVEAFTYVDPPPVEIEVASGETLERDYALLPRDDVGVFTGTLSDGRTGARLDGRIELVGVPEQFAIAVDRSTGFSRRLPPGWYQARIAKFGYRVLTDTVKIASGATESRDYRLEPLPRVLLVDGDAWAYTGAGAYFRASLDRLGYTYHAWSVTDLGAGPGAAGGPPDLEDLAAYDLVIWSSSVTGPTFVRGARTLSAFLDRGGRLLLSGQDALCTDAGTDVATDPCNGKARPDPYVREQLKVRVLEDNARATRVIGADDGPFAGLAFTLNGPDSMDNQSMPDVLAVSDPLHGRPAAVYGDGRAAAVLADACLPHRSLALGFGFEGVAGAAARDALLRRSLDALVAERPEHAVFVRAEPADLIVPAGATALFTGTVTNTGSGDDTFAVAVAEGAWPASLWDPGFSQPLADSVSLGACESARFGLRVGVPETAVRGTAASTRVEARSVAGTAVSQAGFTTRTPAPVLVVDGDYGRDTEGRYLEALRASGTAYDLWVIGRNGATPAVPTADDLDGYPAVVWFTGDDWRPNGSLNLQAQRALAEYLDAGGRLLLSSEDYLSIRSGTPFDGERLFHREYLGVQSFQANIGSAHAGPLHAPASSPLADLEGCRLRSKPPGEDFSDLLVPQAAGSGAAVENLFGGPVATFAVGRAFRSLFLAFDAGHLDEGCSAALMAGALDWFSPLHESAVSLDPPGRGTFASGDRVRLRLSLVNGGPSAVDGVRVRWTIPQGAELEPSGYPATWSWDPESRTLSWRGDLSRNQSLVPDPVVEFRLADGLPFKHRMTSSAVIAGQGITITRRASWTVNAPDLSTSSKSVPDDERVRLPGQWASFVVQVRNTGTEPAAFVVTDTLPAGLALDPDSLIVDRGAAPGVTDGDRITWRADVEPGRAAVLTYRARVTTYAGGWLRNVAVLDDGAGDARTLSAAVFARPKLFLPWVAAEVDPDP